MPSVERLTAVVLPPSRSRTKTLLEMADIGSVKGRFSDGIAGIIGVGSAASAVRSVAEAKNASERPSGLKVISPTIPAVNVLPVVTLARVVVPAARSRTKRFREDAPAKGSLGAAPAGSGVRLVEVLRKASRPPSGLKSGVVALPEATCPSGVTLTRAVVPAARSRT